VKCQNKNLPQYVSWILSKVSVILKMCIVVYSCDTVIMFCALSVKLMYRHFNKPYVLMLHAMLFSLFQYASTVVTYMIVLVQFDQSDKSQNACSRNVTNRVT
jgi:hypothetical protein